MDPRGFPTSLPEFQSVFPDDEACAKYLETDALAKRLYLPQMPRDWRAIPLSNTFLNSFTLPQMQGQHFIDQRHRHAVHAHPAFHMVLGGVSRHHPNAWAIRPAISKATWLYPLRNRLPDSAQAAGGHGPPGAGQHRRRISRRGGRMPFIGGVHNKAVVVGAVEVRLRKDAELRAAKHKQEHAGGVPLKKLVYAGRLRLRVVPSRGAGGLVDFHQPERRQRLNRANRCLARLSYPARLRLCPRAAGNLDGDPEKAEGHLPMIHLVFSNLKTWILGTHHGCIGQQHLQAYLNEYVFRFNRRFYPHTAFNSVLGLAAHAASPTYEQLYSGEWQHPAA